MEGLCGLAFLFLVSLFVHMLVLLLDCSQVCRWAEPGSE